MTDPNNPQEMKITTKKANKSEIVNVHFGNILLTRDPMADK
jgi:hypothetical protein